MSPRFRAGSRRARTARTTLVAGTAAAALLASGAALAQPATAATAQRSVNLGLALPTLGAHAGAELKAAGSAGLSALRGRLGSLGLRVTAKGAYSAVVSGPAGVVTDLFGSVEAPTVPASLSDLATVAVDPDSDDHPWTHYLSTASPSAAHAVSEFATTPAQLDADYGLGAPSTVPPANPQAGPIIATVQFSGWHPSDLTTFAAQEGIYSTPYDPVASGQYSEVDVDRGGYDPSVDDVDTSREVALDQEALLGAAPQLRQRAYIAPNVSDGFLDAYDAIISDIVNNHQPITVLSTSWGACELKDNPRPMMVALEQRLAALTALGVTVVAASGDAGRYDCSQDSSDGVDNTDAVDFPASSPYVVGVGGTEHVTGQPERVYDEPGGFFNRDYKGNGSGGGASKVFSRPVWQAGVSLTATTRMVPDLAADASVATGINVWHEGSEDTVGGTSLAAPIVAAELASVEARHTGGSGTGLGDIHPALYRAASTFTSVLAQGNSAGTVVQPIKSGYDEATGLGAPRWNALEAALYAPAPKAPGTAKATVATYAPTGTVKTTLKAATGQTATRWYVSPGGENSCTGAGSTSPPKSVKMPEGQTKLWIHYTTKNLVCSAAKVVLVTAPIDDRHAHRTGSWHGASSSRAYKGTLLESASAGAALSATGTGRHLSVVLMTGPGEGLAQILVDGNVVKTIDTGTGSRAFGKTVAVTTKKSGKHTIAVRVLGAAGAGGGRTVAVDGLVIAP